MELNERQRKILEGKICPYCGRETKLVDAEKIYRKKGFGMIMLCEPCMTWVGVHTAIFQVLQCAFLIFHVL